MRGTFIIGGSRTAATSKLECFVIIVNDWKPLTITTKSSIMDVAAVLDTPPFNFLMQKVSLMCQNVNFS